MSGTNSIYEYVMGCLAAPSCPSYAEIQRGSGVSKRTVEKIARREIKDPGVSHVEKLERFFRARSEGLNESMAG